MALVLTPRISSIKSWLSVFLGSWGREWRSGKTLCEWVHSHLCHGCPEWHTAMHSLRLQRLLWIYCPEHAESVGMNGQIDWQAQQISHLVCSLAGLRCWEAWGTFWTWTDQSIKALIAWRKEEWRKEAVDIPPSKVENDLCSTRQILALFRRQPWEDCWEMGWSAYGPFRAPRCHLELKLKSETLSLWTWSSVNCVLLCFVLLCLHRHSQLHYFQRYNSCQCHKPHLRTGTGFCCPQHCSWCIQSFILFIVIMPSSAQPTPLPPCV